MIFVNSWIKKYNFEKESLKNKLNFSERTQKSMILKEIGTTKVRIDQILQFWNSQILIFVLMNFSIWFWHFQKYKTD